MQALGTHVRCTSQSGSVYWEHARRGTEACVSLVGPSCIDYPTLSIEDYVEARYYSAIQQIHDYYDSELVERHINQ